MSHLSRLALLLLLPALAACGETQSANETPKVPPAVLVQRVTFGADTSSATYAATIQPRIVSEQAFRVSGKVTRRLVNVGDRVVAGQALAEIDTADLQLQLTQAEAEVSAAANSLKQQQAENERTAKLGADGWLAQSAVDRQQAATDEAVSRLTRAQKSVELARNAIAYGTLTSDSAGVVTATAIDPGKVVSAGQPAVTIALDGEMEALVAIPEDKASAIHRADLKLTIWSKPGKSYALKLRELSPLADPATRTFAARYSIVGADADLRLGMSAQAEATGAAGPVAKLPLAAILDDGQGPKVWSVDKASGGLTLKAVTVAARGSAVAAISAGLNEGEYVVALGAQKLDAGLTVRPIETLQR